MIALAAVLPVEDLQCPSWQPIAFIELALQAVLGLTTLNLAWKCRDIFSEFNETVPTMTITILMALSALVVFSVSSMADLDPHTQYVFQALVLLGTTIRPCVGFVVHYLGQSLSGRAFLLIF